MSEQAERETELVAGVIGGITQKKADTWTVAVTPDESQYAKNLWSKDVDLIESLSTKIGQAGAFVCSVSVWQRDGKDIRSLWIETKSEAVGASLSEDPNTVAPGPTETRSTPAAAPRAGSSEMTKEEWARKDSAIHKMACIKTAADALKHTVPSDPSNEELNKFLVRVGHLATAWHRSVLAERDDPTGEAIPFDVRAADHG